ncbi:hypothetical protein [Dechloromonas agitata]|uniref:hypothetical protein n=1 Tax=Dechloromonas agitata TaxID=73030 RepID=UPI000487B880|nr:hypothetical protein [Dechloromonas agitata]
MDFGNWKRTGGQILREFWIPLLATPAWTAYVTWGKPIEFQKLLETAGPTFFLVSWLTGQVFRIRKQENVQFGLGNIEQRVEAIVGNLEAAAKDVASYATGGDSFCYVAAGIDQGSDKATLTVVHQGKYPIYAVTARLVDSATFQSAAQTGALPLGVIKSVGDWPSGKHGRWVRLTWGQETPAIWTYTSAPGTVSLSSRFASGASTENGCRRPTLTRRWSRIREAVRIGG